MQQPFVQLTPLDQHNQHLEANVRPPEWKNPTPDRPYHLVVIGAGTAGLVTAAGAAGLGARVALIERELMGGDCLNVGCVPSKAIIKSGRVAAAVRDSARFGVNVADQATVDFEQAMERLRRLRSEISPNDSAKRFSEMGIDVYFGQGSFTGNESISVTQQDGNTTELKYRKAVIASGARASAPAIPGLESVDYLTNENLFSLTGLPKRFGIIGSGPIGSEMAQTFARLGSEVFLFERSDRILSREDPTAAAIVQKQFVKDGVQLMLNSQEMKLAPDNAGGIQVAVTRNGVQSETTVDKLLVAVGRAPNIENLNLESVGVKFDKLGVKVNDHLQTANSKIYAAGDVCSSFKFTHAADFQARIVIQNALFAVGPLGKKKASDLVIPWATFTSPEVAHVGLYEHSAKAAGVEIDTYTQSFEDVDRAILEGQTDGFVKIHTKKGSGQIVGATVVSESAGDLISEIVVAMVHKVGLGSIASTIHPYPTHAEAIRKLGDQFNRTKLTSVSRKLLNLLRRINVGS